jgi:hypothetical protein
VPRCALTKFTGIVDSLEQDGQTIDRSSIGGRGVVYADDVGADEIDDVTRHSGEISYKTAGTGLDRRITGFDSTLGRLFDTIGFENKHPSVVTNPDTGINNTVFAMLDGAIV